MITIQIFLKFGNEDNINDLLHNGTIYLNSIQNFRKIEDKQLRGDKYEGVLSIKNYPSGQFEIPSLNYKGDYLALHLFEKYEEVLGNIYSLYCVSSHGWTNPVDFKIDKRVKNFGSHCLMIKKPESFLKRIEDALINLKIKHRHGLVDYYDKEVVNKKITLFEKRIEYEYQKEFRIYVERDSTEPFIFQIGDLSDIAEIYPTDLIVDELKISRKIADEI